MHDDPAPILRELMWAVSRQLIEAQANLGAAQRLADRVRGVIRQAGDVPSTAAFDAAIALAGQATERSIELTRCALDSQIMGLHESVASRTTFDRIVGLVDPVGELDVA